MRLVVIGNGMVGHLLLDTLAGHGALDRMEVCVIGEEPRPAYDRVALSSLFDGRTVEDLAMGEPGAHARAGITFHRGERVTLVDRARKVVHTSIGRCVAYDHLVMATGSSPFVPPIPGADAPGCHVYRTIADLEGIAAHAAAPSVRSGVVIGGGLLGLEAANALRNLGLETHVVELAPHLMATQLDAEGGTLLRRLVEDLGVRVHTDRRTEAVRWDDDGTAHLVLEDHEPLACDMVVFSAGIRPRHELAAAAGLELGERGGILVDEWLRSSDPHISAVGECAAARGRTYGLVAPGNAMARSVAARLAREVGVSDAVAEPFEGADMSTKLKLLGVEVASIGDVHAPAGDDRHRLVWSDPSAGVYQRVDADRSGRIVAAVLVGDASPYARILSRFRSADEVEDPGNVLRPAPDGVVANGPDGPICSCENVAADTLCAAVDQGCSTVAELTATTRAGSGCGGCVPELSALLRDGMARRGEVVSDALCDHFAHTRAELFEIIRVEGLATFEEVLTTHGSPGWSGVPGAGCEVCRPTVASILASLGGGHLLDDHHAAVQDTNDHALANLQRDGTYSVVPRVPGGEITPAGLIAIGEVARDFELYTKITGGQRIDLFGARLEQLPEIWRRLVDAGFESGHAYGKALRTVKSCVGSTWCRYGVADSTTMAIFLEERYRGLRAPHKIKMAVSGCARECAEAQSKDVGVIATERGWNLWVGGNGGMRPRHAELLAEDLDDETLVRYVDRFVMYYVRSADRLQRTASWIESLDGGIDHVREVVVEDSLELAASLEAMVEAHVATYECEWAATLGDPRRLSRFVSFVNAPHEADPTVVFVRERDQLRPATKAERAELSSSTDPPELVELVAGVAS